MLRRCQTIFLPTLVTALLLAAGDGRALTLADLTGGQTFASQNGLSFSNFAAIYTGNQSPTVGENLEIQILTDGFRITGGISAADGAVGDILVTYDVNVMNTLRGPGNPIIGASLSSDVAASLPGAQAAIDELLISSGGLPSIIALNNVKTGGSNTGIFTDTKSFQSAVQSLQVTKDIVVDSRINTGGTGGSATISFIDQRFSVVPEPSTAGMLILGMLGLSVAGRRRAA